MMIWDAHGIKAFRKWLALTQQDLARLIGADIRSVNRWEKGHHQPTGAAIEVLNGIATAFERNPSRQEDLQKILKDALPVGGLAYLMLTLLERAVGR